MATTVTETTDVAEVEREESGNWIARVPALRGVHTHARTLASLRGYLRDAIALWLEVGLIHAGEKDPHVDRDGIAVELQVKMPASARRATDSPASPRAGAKCRG